MNVVRIFFLFLQQAFKKHAFDRKKTIFYIFLKQIKHYGTN